MLEGLHSAAAGMTAQQQRLDAVAHDLANVSTTGYRRLRTSIRDLAYQPGPGFGAGEELRTGAGAATSVVGRLQTQGAPRETGRALDVALVGPGFLQVRRPDGQLALTRDGALNVDAQGRLTTVRGEPIVPPVTLPRGTDTSALAFAADGAITAGGRVVGRLTVVEVASPDALEAIGDSSFRTTAASGGPVAARGTQVLGGHLESSNVDLGAAMVEMMEAQRGFQLASRAVQMQDELLQIANGVKR